MFTHVDSQAKNPLPVRRRILGRLLGSCLERLREAGDRSLEQSVHLARMEVHECAVIDSYRPGSCGALAAGTQSRISSPPEEGGENNQAEGRNRAKKSEHQR